jgi:hypothetical protein
MTFANEKTRAEHWLALHSILRIARPHDSNAEGKFLTGYLDRELIAAGYKPSRDGFGNRWIEVPATSARAPVILWSCHVDTVDATGDEKGVSLGTDGIARLSKRKPGRCLGADDGAGLWLLLEMIRAGVPGIYAFHRGEERGRLGSRHVSEREPGRLAKVDACVAFDRRGKDNIISHQMSERGCSEAFATALGRAINSASGGRLAYSPDDSGSYTDTYSYFGQVSECTNLSVGYQSEHGPNETLDFEHLLTLRAAILRADFSALPIERDCTVTEYADDWRNWGSSSGSYTGGWKAWDDDDGGSYTFGKPGNASRLDESLAALVSEFPDVASDLLAGMGITIMDFIEAVDDAHPAGASNAYHRVMG